MFIMAMLLMIAGFIAGVFLVVFAKWLERRSGGDTDMKAWKNVLFGIALASAAIWLTPMMWHEYFMRQNFP